MNKEKPIHYNIAFNSGRFLTSEVGAMRVKFVADDKFAQHVFIS